MGINIKYYIISIASIFLSLSIGIFIGFNMNGNDIYLDQQQALIGSLEERFKEFKLESDSLRSNIKSLEKENEQQTIFIENTSKDIISEKLYGVNIAFIETTDDYFYSDVKDMLKASGAKLPISIGYTENLFNVNKADLESINTVFQLNLEGVSDLIYMVNNEITNFIFNKEVTEFFDMLITRNYIYSNIDYDDVSDLNIKNVVIAGGSSENMQKKLEILDLDLIKRLNSLNFNIVGVERNDVEESFVSELKKMNISSVDNINTKIGQVSAVYVLLGASGTYGVKETAESIVPLISMDEMRGGYFE